MKKNFQMQIRAVACHTIELGKQLDNYCTTHHAYLLDCLECGKMFHTARPHTRTCTNACRQASYRQRQALQKVGEQK